MLHKEYLRLVILLLTVSLSPTLVLQDANLLLFTCSGSRLKNSQAEKTCWHR